MREQGDILVSSEKDGSVSINLNREDLLDLYSSLRKIPLNDSTFASEEVQDLIKRFFSENKDVQTDPERSRRFFDKFDY
jgi:hypothetical protein